MANQRSSNGKNDTEVTLADVVRAINGLGARIDGLGDRIDNLDANLSTRIDALASKVDKNNRAVLTVLRRHEARISKMESKKS